MKKIFLLTLICLLLITVSETRKTSKSRGSSSRGSSRRTGSNPQPAPTSFSSPQQAISNSQSQSLFGWQQSSARKSKPTQTHSYPSSNTGLSGNNNGKQTPTNNQNLGGWTQGSRNPAPQGHSYPASGGLSGSQSGASYPKQQNTGLSGSSANQGSGYPQQSGGLSGSSANHGSGYPQQTGGISGSSANHGSGYPQSQPGLAGSSNAGYHPQQHGAPPPYSSQGNYNGHHPQQGPPPPYPGYGGSHGGYGSHNGGYGGYGSPSGGYGPPGGGYGQQPGYFGNYGKGYGGVSRTSSALKGVGIAGAGVGTLLTGLALWNLARSTGRTHHTVVYDNRGQPVAVTAQNGTAPAVDPILGDLVNCTLTISNNNATEVLAIPCAIATSFSPNANTHDLGVNNNATDNTVCTITVVTKEDKEFMTTIPCSTLLNTAAENNVTEPPLTISEEPGIMGSEKPMENTSENMGLLLSSTMPVPLALNCSGYMEVGDVRDPVNPCFTASSNLTVVPLQTDQISTPTAA